VRERATTWIVMAMAVLIALSCVVWALAAQQ
jgi:hypothetical protein